MVRAGPDPETDGVVRCRKIKSASALHERTVGQLASWAFGVCRRARSIRNPRMQRLLKKLRR